MFYSSTEKKLVTLKRIYLRVMKEGQENIFYACGESVDKIDLLPQVELIKDKGLKYYI